MIRTFAAIAALLTIAVLGVGAQPASAADADDPTVLYNLTDFRLEADGRINVTNGGGVHDPSPFREFDGEILAPNVSARALQGAPEDVSNIAALPDRGDGRLTALFAGESGSPGDADNRWGLEWFDYDGAGRGGYRVQVRPGWKELRVEYLVVDAPNVIVDTLEVVTLDAPLEPEVDRVGFERDSGIWRVYVNGEQVSTDIDDTRITEFTNVVIGTPSPSRHTYPRWAWWAYTAGSDFVADDLSTSGNDADDDPVVTDRQGVFDELARRIEAWPLWAALDSPSGDDNDDDETVQGLNWSWLDPTPSGWGWLDRGATTDADTDTDTDTDTTEDDHTGWWSNRRGTSRWGGLFAW